MQAAHGQSHKSGSYSMTKKQQPGIEDCFSKQAEKFARHRPEYPDKLFAYLSELCPAHDLAWDCGTGSGQAAVSLVKYFNRVIASDLSPNQISQARYHERILYQVSSAEKTDLDTQSADLITVAQALHWFKLNRFYTEVRRVLKPGGIVAAWCYHLTVISPEIDEIIQNYSEVIVRPYSSERMHYVSDHYQTIPFPFEELLPPRVEMYTHWDLNEMIGFLDSWSSTQKFIRVRSYHPLDEIMGDLHQAWGDPQQKRTVVFPLYIRIGRNPTPESKGQKVLMTVS
jgi:ubiquinone/menaquinone biosynthesis C-methylase UbiE